MNDHEYHEQLLKLSAELFCAGSARHYDPNAYNAVIDKLNKLSLTPIQDRRRRPWGMIALIVLLALVAGFIVISILDVIIFRGPQ